jgi:hypothetical protein
MTDFALKISIRNAHILRRILAKSESVLGFCRKYQLSYGLVNEYLGMRRTPFLQTGELSDTAESLCAALDCMPEDLWPKQIEKIKLKRSTIETELSAAAVQAICDDSEGRAIQRELIAMWAKKLNPREIRAIGLRQAGATYDECAKEFGVTKERFRQIEVKGLRKMREAAGKANIKALRDI